MAPNGLRKNTNTGIKKIIKKTKVTVNDLMKSNALMKDMNSELVQKLVRTKEELQRAEEANTNLKGNVYNILAEKNSIMEKNVKMMNLLTNIHVDLMTFQKKIEDVIGLSSTESTPKQSAIISPMVSGYIINKPIIELRRLEIGDHLQNMYENRINLSPIVEEQCIQDCPRRPRLGQRTRIAHKPNRVQEEQTESMERIISMAGPSQQLPGVLEADQNERREKSKSFVTINLVSKDENSTSGPSLTSSPSVFVNVYSSEQRKRKWKSQMRSSYPTCSFARKRELRTTAKCIRKIVDSHIRERKKPPEIRRFNGIWQEFKVTRGDKSLPGTVSNLSSGFPTVIHGISILEPRVVLERHSILSESSRRSVGGIDMPGPSSEENNTIVKTQINSDSFGPRLEKAPENPGSSSEENMISLVLSSEGTLKSPEGKSLNPPSPSSKGNRKSSKAKIKQNIRRKSSRLSNNKI